MIYFVCVCVLSRSFIDEQNLELTGLITNLRNIERKSSETAPNIFEKPSSGGRIPHIRSERAVGLFAVPIARLTSDKPDFEKKSML